MLILPSPSVGLNTSCRFLNLSKTSHGFSYLYIIIHLQNWAHLYLHKRGCTNTIRRYDLKKLFIAYSLAWEHFYCKDECVCIRVSLCSHSVSDELILIGHDSDYCCDIKLLIDENSRMNSCNENDHK